MIRCLTCISLLLLVSRFRIAFAQEVRASISGIVSDPSGAPVANAVVTVTSSSTNSSMASKTNDAGTYLSPFLPPGTYALTVEHPGFRKFVRESIVLESLDKARVDVQLQIGALADSVTVSAAVTTLQTETASGGRTISNELNANLPTQGPNPTQNPLAAPRLRHTG